MHVVHMKSRVFSLFILLSGVATRPCRPTHPRVVPPRVTDRRRMKVIKAVVGDASVKRP